MNFAIPFFRKFKYLNEDNLQLNINYKPQIKKLKTFIEEYGNNHRINLIINNENFNISQDLDLIYNLRMAYPDVKIIICLPYFTEELENQTKKRNLPHYYNEYISSWDRYVAFLSLAVSDIFITEELAFEIKDVSALAKKYNKSLRVFCNVCQSSWEKTLSLKTFFIRPEDIDLYANYIDTFEFYIKENDYHSINILYEVYSKDKKWFGLLNEIIFGYNGDEDDRFIFPNFGNARLNCGKRCLKQKSCKICDRILQLNPILKEKNIFIELSKEEDKNE